MTNVNLYLQKKSQSYNMEHKISSRSFPSCDNIKREEESLFYAIP